MHADPTDRIISVAGPEISPVSVPRIFAAGLALPFAHPIRLLLGSVLPAILIAAAGWGPLGRVFAAWQTMLAPVPFGSIGAPPSIQPEQFGIDLLEAQGIVLLGLALWLCTWQRAAARGFTEPILRWLGGSLLRLPGYILAFAIWVLAPVVVLAIPLGAFAGLIARIIAFNPGLMPLSQAPGDQAAAVFGIFSDLQWWVIAAAIVTVALIALWLNARLSPLPALVASQGWRRAFGRAWELSRGHGFGLSIALCSYTLVAIFVLVVTVIIFGIALYKRSGFIDSGTGITMGGIDLFVTALVGIWHASLGALVVRDGLSPAEALDLATFD